MKLDYFKTGLWGDCYVPEKNFCKIIGITKEHIEFWADDENMLEGAYKTLNISKKNYDELKNAAKNKDREKGLTLIRKLHEENESTLKNPCFHIKINPLTQDTNPNISFKWTKDFLDRKPILN